MVGMHAICNGVLIKMDEAVVNVTNRAVQFGFSTYEAIRIICGHPVHLEDHLFRLEKSCKGIKLSHGFSHQDISSWVYDLIAADDLQRASMRIQIYGGQQPQLFITSSTLLEYPDSYYQEGVGAITYQGERLFPACKTGNLLLNYMALEEARQNNCFEALLVDREGRVLEGTRSNFFAFRGNVLYTAPDDLVLLGVTRDRVLKAALQLGMEVILESPLAKDLKSTIYDEVFISSTSMAALPLSTLDGKVYPGPFERTLKISRLVRSWELDD